MLYAVIFIKKLNKMTKWITKTLLSALAVFFISWLLPGVSIQESYMNAIIVALVISILNTFVKPILVLLTLPATILSLGLFMWVINAGIIMLADYFLGGFEVTSFWWALLFGALLSIINSFLTRTFLPAENRSQSVFVGNQRRNIENEGTTTSVTGKKIKMEDGKKTIIIEKD